MLNTNPVSIKNGYNYLPVSNFSSDSPINLKKNQIFYINSSSYNLFAIDNYVISPYSDFYVNVTSKKNTPIVSASKRRFLIRPIVQNSPNSIVVVKKLFCSTPGTNLFSATLENTRQTTSLTCLQLTLSLRYIHLLIQKTHFFTEKIVL